MGLYEIRAERLKKWWLSKGKEMQDKYEDTLPIKTKNRVSRNKTTHGGWVVAGVAGITRVVKLSGCPWDYYWSGSNPTPSTQIPKVIFDNFYCVVND